MNSIKTKVIILVLSFVAFAALAIGGTSIINSRKVVDTDSRKIMNLLCENSATHINTLLSNIEETVDSLTFFIEKQFFDIEASKEDEAMIENFSQSVLDVAINAADNTQGAKTVYLRFNPEFASPTSGFFYHKNEDEVFEAFTPTDLSAYDEQDKEHVGWFYEPKLKQEAIWMAPYYNDNIDTEIISYVVPFYYEGEFIGIVGMDIEFHALQSVVANTSVYESGYAFLVDGNSEIVYHRDILRGSDLVSYNEGEFHEMAMALKTGVADENTMINYQYHGNAKAATFRLLSNGMRFVLSAPSKEINAQANMLLEQIILTMIAILCIAIILTFIFTKRLVRPLFELNNAAKQIAAGDLSITISHHSNDEVGTLAESFRQTVAHLQTYFSYVQKLAYKDTLTGVKNTTAYVDATKEIDANIAMKKQMKLAILVFDINFLKMVNDTYGHASGDAVIIQSSRLICHTFMHSPVYRIGGDEFVAMLQNEDYDALSTLILEFRSGLGQPNDRLPKGIVLSMACGIAHYDESHDTCYRDIFQKADAEMYLDKARIKAIAQEKSE